MITSIRTNKGQKPIRRKQDEVSQGSTKDEVYSGMYLGDFPFPAFLKVRDLFSADPLKIEKQRLDKEIFAMVKLCIFEIE